MTSLPQAATTMNQASPSRLVIPSSSASPTSTTNLQTGRPPLWTTSSQRKMCRLYLYTTLNITKILEVVHHPTAPDSMPGKDSANKKLNALLDKEPRWLKPRNEDDMFKRCDQLALSPTRTNAVPSPSPFARTHSYSAPPPFSHGSTTPIKQERGAQSATLEVPPWSHSPAGQFPSSPSQGASTPQAPADYQVAHGRSVSDDMGGANANSRLIRATTGLSTSTDQTTGSLHRILANYSEPYIRSVKRLVKRYTAPLGQSQMGMSPLSDSMIAEPTWVSDSDASTVFNTRPFPLPGDFLSMDLHLERQSPCFSESEEHRKRWCMCYAQVEVPESLWATAQGPSLYGVHLIAAGPSPFDTGSRDAFGNTMLHFLAARGPDSVLIQAIRTDFCEPILNVKNSAGQTFLHVLGESWFQHTEALFRLLDVLVFIQGDKFNMAASDHYGRTFFHQLLSSEILGSTLEFIFQRYLGCGFTRDAFGFQLTAQGPGSTAGAMDIDQPETSAPWEAESELYLFIESHFLKLVRKSQDEPGLEDKDGRNGLHCLAMASLSKKSALSKANLSPTTPQGRQKKRGKTAEEMIDSSEERLALRHQLVQGLLDAGVDPNHYDNYGNTPLMAFCAELMEDDDYKTGPMIINLLLERGANIHARNRAGETALHIAVRCGRKLAVKTLIDKGANIHARDATGRGVLTLADVKMETCREDMLVEYCHYEACRAHLSGKGAVQEPSVLQEWGMK